MTEVPDHLMQRSRERRLAMEQGGADAVESVGLVPPELLDFDPPAPEPKPERDPHCTIDWFRFGERPQELADEVLDFVKGQRGGDEYRAHFQEKVDTARFGRRTLTGAQVIERGIGEHTLLRLGHIEGFEGQKTTWQKFRHAARRFGWYFVQTNEGRNYRGVDLSRELEEDDFSLPTPGEYDTPFSIVWADILTKRLREGEDEPRNDTLVSFILKVTDNPPVENSPNDPLTVQLWGSSAHVIHPMTDATDERDDRAGHTGYSTWPYIPAVSEGLVLQELKPGTNRLAYTQGLPIRWASMGGTSAQEEPIITDTVEAAMDGIRVGKDMIRDPDLLENLDTHNAHLQRALRPFA